MGRSPCELLHVNDASPNQQAENERRKNDGSKCEYPPRRFATRANAVGESERQPDEWHEKHKEKRGQGTVQIDVPENEDRRSSRRNKRCYESKPQKHSFFRFGTHLKQLDNAMDLFV
jgi:hypothetical protein